MILRSAGFVTSDLIGGQNAVNFAYILYLRGRAENVPAADLERLVRRWYAMSILRGRYTGSPETAFDFDIRQIEARGLVAYAESVIDAELPESFWTGMLPQLMDTSSAQSPYFLAYKAAQVKLGDKGFLSRDITVLDLLMNRSDVHHVYPRNHLKKQGLSRGRYNQIANFVLAQSEINIAIGDKAPEKYFEELAEQCAGGKKKYGGITDATELRANLRMSCLPESLLDGEIPTYDDFLEAAPQAHGAEDQDLVRVTLMTADIRGWRSNNSMQRTALRAAADAERWGAGKASQRFPIEPMTTQGLRPSSPSISVARKRSLPGSLDRRVASLSAIGYRSVPGPRSPAPFGLSAVASETLSPSLACRVAIPSAIGYRSVHGLRSPAPLVSPWPVGPVASPSLGAIGQAHAPTMRFSRRRETPSLFQAFVAGAADLDALGGAERTDALSDLAREANVSPTELRS